MVSKTTSFKKGKGKKGYFMKRQISCCSSEEAKEWAQARDSVLLLQGKWSLEAEPPQVLSG